MFKKIFVGILMCLMMFSCVGLEPIPEGEQRIEYITEVQGFEKDYLYDNIRMWIAENFKSAKAVIEYEETDTIIGNGVYIRGRHTYHFTMKVNIKDNKFRLIFSNIKISWDKSRSKLATGSYINFPGYNGPLRNKNQLAFIKPRLLAFGDQIKTYIEQGENKKDW